MGEDDHRGIWAQTLDVLLEPFELLFANAPRPANRALEHFHHVHSLLGRQSSGDPEIAHQNGVHANEVNSLMVKGPRRFSKVSAPGRSHIQVPIVFTGYEVNGHAQFREELLTLLQLIVPAVLRNVAAVNDKFGK